MKRMKIAMQNRFRRGRQTFIKRSIRRSSFERAGVIKLIIIVKNISIKLLYLSELVVLSSMLLDDLVLLSILFVL